MKIRREDCLIIGGMRAARGGAAFARAPLVVECGGALYIARRIGHSEDIEGEPMSPEEWRGVRDSGEALKLCSKSCPATPSAALWLMRPNFFFRDEALDALDQRGAVLHRENLERSLVVLVDESAASGLADQWAEHACNQAWTLAMAKRLNQAVEAAELAMDLKRGFQVNHVALLSLLYERLGDKERAEAYLELARNSCGDAFYERALQTRSASPGSS